MGKIKNSNQYLKKPVSTANTKKTFDRYQPGKPGFNRKMMVLTQK